MEIGLNMAQGGSFYRSTQNAYKVNKAVNSMLNRLDTGEKYQYAYENVAAVVEGADLAGKISGAASATERNKKYQQQFDPVMKAQTEILSMLGQAKELGMQYNNLSATERTTGTGVGLEAQFNTIRSAISTLAGNVGNIGTGGTITAGLDTTLTVDDKGTSYAMTTGAFAFAGTIGDTATLDTAMRSMSQQAAYVGAAYKNVLGSFNSVMTADINAMSQRRSDLVIADDNETMAILSTLSSRMDAISAARQYSAQYRGNALALNILA